MREDVVATTTQTYDRTAADYDARTRDPAPAYLHARTSFAASVAGPVVDLGCGPGRDLAALRDAGVQAFGVDLSAGMLALASGRGLPVARGDLRRPPLRPRSLGGIWSSAALLHIPREQVPATLRAWHELLRPGGRLGLSTSLGTDEGWEALPYPGPPVDGAGRWFVHHEPDVLLALVAAAGFQVLGASERESHRRWLQVTALA